MDIHTETEIRIEFAKGAEFEPTVVLESVDLNRTETFSNKTHQIEEFLGYIEYHENSGAMVYL